MIVKQETEISKHRSAVVLDIQKYKNKPFNVFA